MVSQTNEAPRKAKIAVLPGDGIGPEVIAEAVKVLEVVAQRTGLELEMIEVPVGGAAIDAYGDPLPDQTVEACLAADAVLLGAVGGPRWDSLPREKSPESGLLRLRRVLSVYANLRPVRLKAGHPVRTPLRSEVIKDGIDIIILRELTGGLYYGERGREQTPNGITAYDTLLYSEAEIERILCWGFELAAQRTGRLTSVDKANVLESSRLWRETANKIASKYPNVDLDHIYVDNCAMQLVRAPDQFDVIVTENTFGDILSDLGGALVGSLGTMPSASLGDPGKPGLYEPIHGSAPDIAGKGISNPLGTIGSVSMLLRYSLGMHAAADAVDAAIDHVLLNGPWTADIAPDPSRSAGTAEVGTAVCQQVEAQLS